VLAPPRILRRIEDEVASHCDAQRQIVEQVEDIVVAQRQHPEQDDAGGREHLRAAREHTERNQQLEP
jgi:hypothetical protein